MWVIICVVICKKEGNEKAVTNLLLVTSETDYLDPASEIIWFVYTVKYSNKPLIVLN